MDLLDDLLNPTTLPSFDDAARAAIGADRLADVFTTAYRGAVTRAFGTSGQQRTALCVTEDGGNTPRAIQTRWADGVLHGAKSFVTFGAQSDELLVLAVRGETEGRKDLVIVQVSGRTGVAFEKAPAPSFVPEVPHSRVTFDGAPATLWCEDAWSRIKAFRLIEDVFVLGATVAWFMGLATQTRQAKLVEQLASLLLAARAVAALDPSAVATHLAYEGTQRAANAAFALFDWSDVPERIETLWVRDRALLEVAQRAREMRAERARETLMSIPEGRER